MTSPKGNSLRLGVVSHRTTWARNVTGTYFKSSNYTLPPSMEARTKSALDMLPGEGQVWVLCLDEPA